MSAPVKEKTTNRFKSSTNRFETKPASTNTALVPTNASPTDLAVQNAAQNKLSVAPAIPTSGYLTSTAIIEEHRNSGVLSAEKAQEMWNQVVVNCEKMTTAIDAAHVSMKVAIEEFRRDSKAENMELVSYATKLMNEIRAGQAVTQGTIENTKFVLFLSGEVQKRRFETVKQLSELHKLDLENLLGNYKGVMIVMYDARLKEIDALSKMLIAVQEQEIHKQTIEIAYHNQQLQAENQTFEQALALAKFQSERFEKKRELDIKDQKRQDAHEVQVKELELKEQTAEHAMATDLQRLALEKTAQQQAQALALKKAEDQKELAARYLDIEDESMRKGFELQMKKAADEYALGLGQLDNEKQRDQLKSQFLNKQQALNHQARMEEIGSAERRRLTEIRSQEFIQQLDINTRADLQRRGIDAGLQQRKAEIASHEKIKMRELDPRCTIA